MLVQVYKKNTATGTDFSYAINLAKMKKYKK